PGEGRKPKWSACGTVTDIDEIGLTVTIRRGPTGQRMGRPTALIPYDNVRTNEQRAALQRVARWVRDYGATGAGPYQAARDLLLRLPPRRAGEGGLLAFAGETPLQVAVRLGLELDHGTLAIQGPPGSGKTFTAA